MNDITCQQCGATIELTQALTRDIEKDIMKNVAEKHQQQLENTKKELEQQARKDAEQAIEKARSDEAKRLDVQLKQAEEARKDSDQQIKALTEQLSDVMKQMRASQQREREAEVRMQKQLAEEEAKIREQATKNADEKQRLAMAEKDKQIENAKRQVEDMQRKLQQGSQQMQGEILELDLEEALEREFRDDDIAPVEKGVRGADIRQTVKSPRGTSCGVMLWEIKRTKNWSEGWVQKFKDDVLASKADVPILITEAFPQNVSGPIAVYKKIYLAKPQSAIVLATLLRKGLLDVGYQKALAQHRDTASDALFTYVTGNEFAQQVEAMVQVYIDMKEQVDKERRAFEKQWKMREAYAQRLLDNTAGIIGGMQGRMGAGVMPKIKGLDVDDMMELGE